MLCPKCGKENPDDAQSCFSCNSVLTGVPITRETVNVKASRLGIASMVFGIVSIFALIFVIAMVSLSLFYAFIVFLITAIAATVLGIIALVQIEINAGRVVGKGSAVVGVVVSVVMLFLMGILLPALQRLRTISFRDVCGSNLYGIGKAMLLYANDYDGRFPRAGGKESVWAAKINDWKATDKHTAFNLKADGSGGQASISSSLYLLVKYKDVTPRTFVCMVGDPKAREFKLSEHGIRDRKFIDFWDFGPDPPKHYSYSYHIPYGPYPLTTSSEPGMAVAADRNPWIPSPFAKANKDFSKFNPNGMPEQQRYGNSVVHEGEGQNVLFVDGHVYFEKRPFCGVKDDNIYTFWSGGDIRRGAPPVIGSQPASRVDSLLVNDPPTEAKKPKRSWWPWRR